MTSRKKSFIDINTLVRRNILQMKPYASARDEFKGVASIFLDANENPYDTGLNRYPDPLAWAVKKELSVINQNWYSDQHY